KKHLKRGRDFFNWMKIARGYDEARREAMHRAGTNVPQGSAYREEFAKIDRREKLIDRDDKGREFPSPEDRTYTAASLPFSGIPENRQRKYSASRRAATVRRNCSCVMWPSSMPQSTRSQ